jgi:hypothetical protein
MKPDTNNRLPAVARIDFTITQDWSKLIQAYENIKQKWQSGGLKNKKWIKEYNTEQFDFGAYGSLVSLDSISDTPYSAAMLNGIIVVSLLPWAKQLQKDLEELDITAMTFFETQGPINPHKDGVIKDSDYEGHCRLNYIITDCDAVTYVDNDGEIESYPSKAGTAWLLNTQKQHWVDNQGTRHLFQVAFNKPFDKVLAWFNSRPALHYGA